MILERRKANFHQGAFVMTSGSAGANGPIGDLPRAAFCRSVGTHRAEIEALMRRALDMVIDRAATAASRSPHARCAAARGVDRIPDAPLAEEEILERLLAAMDGSMNAAHPGYIGHMDSIPATFSILGDLAAGALNNNMLSMDMSALLSRLEPALVRTFAREFFGWARRRADCSSAAAVWRTSKPSPWRAIPRLARANRALPALGGVLCCLLPNCAIPRSTKRRWCLGWERAAVISIPARCARENGRGAPSSRDRRRSLAWRCALLRRGDRRNHSDRKH
jgi:hypothetical protein